MTEDDVIRVMRVYIEQQFPRVCPTCGRRFESLRDYLENTTHLDSPIIYEKDGEDHSVHLGPMSLANCNTCGTTITVGSSNIPRAQLAELLRWARRESAQRHITVRQLLHHLRDRIDAQVFGHETG
jgi:endogenous inhibitor of DNA gyrase (YacG/DUF329 family)